MNFSESVTVAPASFTLVCNAVSQAFTLNTTSGSSITLTPSAPLPYGQTCVVTVVAAQVTDQDGIYPYTMAANHVFDFTTESRPAVTSVLPVNGTTGVALNSTLTVNFSESVTVSTASFTLLCGAANKTFTLDTTSGTSVTLTPSAPLPSATSCTATVIAAQVADQDGPADQMAGNFGWSFTTIDLAPAVTTVTPVDNTTNVAVNATVGVNFNESVTVSTASFTLVCNAVSKTFTLNSTSGTSFTLTPSSSLPYGQTCVVTVVANQVADQDGVAPLNMAANYIFDFVTENRPAVSSTTPADGAIDVAANITITVNFSEDVTVSDASFTLVCDGVSQGFGLSGTSGASFILTPDADMPVGKTCVATVIAAQVADQDGPADQMAANHAWSFSTTDASPAVITTTPADNATNVALNTTVVVSFSESVTVSPASFTLVCNAVSQAFTLDGTSGTSFTLTPDSDLPYGQTCLVTVVAAQVADQDGIAPLNMAADYIFDFVIELQPAVSSTTPADNAVDVVPSANLTVTFSEAVTAPAAASKSVVLGRTSRSACLAVEPPLPSTPPLIYRLTHLAR